MYQHTNVGAMITVMTLFPPQPLTPHSGIREHRPALLYHPDGALPPCRREKSAYSAHAQTRYTCTRTCVDAHTCSHARLTCIQKHTWSTIAVFTYVTEADNKQCSFVTLSCAARTVVCVTSGGAVDTIVEPFAYFCPCADECIYAFVDLHVCACGDVEFCVLARV